MGMCKRTKSMAPPESRSTCDTVRQAAMEPAVQRLEENTCSRRVSADGNVGLRFTPQPSLLAAPIPPCYAAGVTPRTGVLGCGRGWYAGPEFAGLRRPRAPRRRPPRLRGARGYVARNCVRNQTPQFGALLCQGLNSPRSMLLTTMASSLSSFRGFTRSSNVRTVFAATPHTPKRCVGSVA
jgi:hypothetical protein